MRGVSGMTQNEAGIRTLDEDAEVSSNFSPVLCQRSRDIININMITLHWNIYRYQTFVQTAHV